MQAVLVAAIAMLACTANEHVMLSSYASHTCLPFEIPEQHVASPTSYPLVLCACKRVAPAGLLLYKQVHNYDMRAVLHALLQAWSDQQAWWRALLEVALPVQLQHGCHSPMCTNLKSPSEAAFKTKLCTGCSTARFCSKACQTAAWPRHKSMCKRIAAAKARRHKQPA